MKVHALWIMTIAIGLAACGGPDQTETAPAESADAAPQAAPQPHAQVDQAFLDHMHAHADMLDELMFALADDDLEGAMTPAFWLSRHETVTGIPEEWQQYVIGMREAAAAVEAASSLEAARTAAEQISVHCQECHAVAGVNTIQ